MEHAFEVLFRHHIAVIQARRTFCRMLLSLGVLLVALKPRCRLLRDGSAIGVQVDGRLRRKEHATAAAVGKAVPAGGAGQAADGSGPVRAGFPTSASEARKQRYVFVERLRFRGGPPDTWSATDRTPVLLVRAHTRIAMATEEMAARKGSDLRIGTLETNRTIVCARRHPTGVEVCTCVRVCVAVLANEPLKEVPDEFTDDDRKSFVQIAHRSRAEHVNYYTIIALGAEIFLRMQALKSKTKETKEKTRDESC